MSTPGTERFRKKPVVVEAMCYDGTNAETVIEWVNHYVPEDADPAIWEDRSPTFGPWLTILTLEGEMMASPGDWIIRGVVGEFYPCKPDVFDATYEPVEPLASGDSEGAK